MKKIKFGIIILLTLSIISGLVFAQGTTTRYLIKSNNLGHFFEVQHKFDNGFTTDLSQGQIKALKKLGVELEEVPQYHISARPVCGDNKCQGNEPKTCPLDCPSEPGPDPNPEERTCFPSSQTPYGVSMINGGSGGLGVSVAVLDSGANKDHLDLDISVCKDFTKKGIKNGCKDGNGHGSHTAGTVAANKGSDGSGITGVAPDSNLWALKVCGNSGFCFTDDMAVAIKYAADNGANIISMSISGDAKSTLVTNAIDYAVSKGVLVVAAAGNDGPKDGSIDYSAAYVKVIAVGAIDINEQVPSFSSRGLNDGDFIIEEKEVELAAAGVNVESTWKDGCYRKLSGTSMATPHIAGLAAKLWQGNAADTRSLLQDLAKNHDLHTPGDDTATGFGLPIAP